jgi:hypothetical protein
MRRDLTSEHSRSKVGTPIVLPTQGSDPRNVTRLFGRLPVTYGIPHDVRSLRAGLLESDDVDINRHLMLSPRPSGCWVGIPFQSLQETVCQEQQTSKRQGLRAAQVKNGGIGADR